MFIPVVWVRGLLRIHDNPVLLQLERLVAGREASAARPLFFHIDADALTRAAAGAHDRFAAELRRFGAPDAAEDVVVRLSDRRRAFWGALVHSFRARVCSGPGLDFALFEVDPDSASSLGAVHQAGARVDRIQAKKLAAEARGSCAAQLVASHVRAALRVAHGGAAVEKQVVCVYDRRFDPESLIEETSFRAELERLLARAETPAGVSFLPVAAHNLVDGDMQQYTQAFPFRDKALAYNPFVSLIEGNKVPMATPIEEEDCAAALARLQRRRNFLQVRHKSGGSFRVVLPAGRYAGQIELLFREIEASDVSQASVALGDSCAIDPSEAFALRRLRAIRDSYIAQFSKPHSNPMATTPSTTALSPYFASGALSVRLAAALWGQAEARVRAAGGKTTKPPQSLLGQLYWREFAHWLHFHVGMHFDQISNNPVCLQQDWGHEEAQAQGQAGKKAGAEVEEEANLQRLRRMFFANFLDAEGAPTLAGAGQHVPQGGGRAARSALLHAQARAAATPFAALNSGLSQVRETGWAHHIMRHLIACYLTRVLDVSWEVGRDFFEHVLLDFDASINASQWQWLSCSFLFYNFNRVYWPEGFKRKWDAKGKFVCKWAPGTIAADSAAGGVSRESGGRGDREKDGSEEDVYKQLSDRAIARLKGVFLRQDDVFLANVQRNVIEEWKTEDPSFGSSLESKVEAARRARQASSVPHIEPTSAAAHAAVCLQYPVIRVGSPRSEDPRSIGAGGDRGGWGGRGHGGGPRKARHNTREEWHEDDNCSVSIEHENTSGESQPGFTAGAQVECRGGSAGGRSRRRGRLQNHYIPE